MFKALKRITAPATTLVSTADAKAHLRIDDGDEDALIASLVLAATEKMEEHLRQSFIEQTWEVRLDAMPVSGVELPRPPLIGVEEINYWPDLADSVQRGRGAKLVKAGGVITIDQVLSEASGCRATDTKGAFKDVNMTGPSAGTNSTTYSGMDGVSDGTYYVDYAVGEATVWSRLTAFDVEVFDIPPVVRLREDDVPNVSSDQGAPWRVSYTSGYGSATTDVPDAIIASVKGLLTHLFEHRGEDPRQIPIPDFIKYMVSHLVVPHKL